MPRKLESPKSVHVMNYGSGSKELFSYSQFVTETFNSIPLCEKGKIIQHTCSGAALSGV